MILTREVLESYSLLRQEIERLRGRIDYWTNLAIPSEHGIVKGSMSEFPYAERHFEISAPNVKTNNARYERIQQLIATLKQREEEYIQFGIDITFEIEKIPDMAMRQMIVFKYIEGMTDKEIGEKMGYDRSVVNRKMSNFFKICT